MRYFIIAAAVLLGSCRARSSDTVRGRDTTDLAGRFPLQRDSIDSLARTPLVVDDPSVVLFWLIAADTLATEDQAIAFDDLRSNTEQIGPALATNQIGLFATRSDTLFVTLPGNRRRMILLSGLDYPFGYVLVDPGGPERILTGMFADEDLLDELRAYFDLSDDSTSATPRATT